MIGNFNSDIPTQDKINYKKNFLRINTTTLKTGKSGIKFQEFANKTQLFSSDSPILFIGSHPGNDVSFC